jgi:hypothetical protein
MSPIAPARNFTPSSRRNYRETWYHPDKRAEGNTSQSGLRPVEQRPMAFNMKTNKIHSLVLALFAVLWVAGGCDRNPLTGSKLTRGHSARDSRTLIGFSDAATWITSSRMRSSGGDSYCAAGNRKGSAFSCQLPRSSKPYAVAAANSVELRCLRRTVFH